MAKYTKEQIADITDVNVVYHHYLIAQIWTGLFEPGEGEEPVELDSKINGIEDLTDDVKDKMFEDVKNFCAEVRRLLRSYAVRENLSAEQLGHDFSLTRNHHGAGFWDRGYGRLGDTLTKMSQAYGSESLYAFPGSGDVNPHDGISFELTS